MGSFTRDSDLYIRAAGSPQGTQWCSPSLPSLCLFASLFQNVNLNCDVTGNIFCCNILAIYLVYKKRVFYLENRSRNSWPSLFSGAGRPWFQSKKKQSSANCLTSFCAHTTSQLLLEPRKGGRITVQSFGTNQVALGRMQFFLFSNSSAFKLQQFSLFERNPHKTAI